MDKRIANKVKIIKPGSGSQDKTPKSKVQILKDKWRRLKRELREVEKELGLSK